MTGTDMIGYIHGSDGRALGHEAFAHTISDTSNATFVLTMYDDWRLLAAGGGGGSGAVDGRLK